MEPSDRLKLLQLAMDEEEDSARSSRSGIWEPPSETALEKAIPGFHIDKLIAIGGMAAVYRAHDEESRQVAIKLMPVEFESDPLLSTRFESEMKILSGFKHNRIVQVLSTGTTSDGLRYIAMEYLPGGTLRGKREFGEAVQIMLQICEGLEHSHSHNVIHRDLKPSNILLAENGSVKIADFGLAKKMRSQSEAHSLTLTGAQLGTPHYMAPEMLSDESSADARSDIYSLGVIFYQLLTGKIPVGHYEKASRSASVSRATDRLLARAMSVDPDKRFQSVTEMRESLERLSRAREIAKKRWQAALLIVGFLGVAGTVLYREIVVPPDSPLIHSKAKKEQTYLPWQSKILWGDSPFENEEWARDRDFSAGPGTRMQATIREAGKHSYFRGRNLFLRPGSELQLRGSAGKIKADSIVLDGGMLTLIDERPPLKGSLRFNSNSEDTGALVVGNIRVESASQLVRSESGIGPRLASSLSGSAPLLIGQTESLDTFIFSGDNREYSGDWQIEGFVRIDSPTGLGSGSVIIGSGSLRLPPLPIREQNREPVESGPVFVSSIGKLLIRRNASFQSLAIDGEAIPPGEYDSKSALANRIEIGPAATLIIRETSGEPPNHFLPVPGQEHMQEEKAPRFLASSDGEWNDSRIWNPRISVRARVPGAGWVPSANQFRVPDGRTIEVGPLSPGWNFFEGQKCVIEQGGCLSFTKPGAVLVFPALQLNGATIRHWIDPSSPVLSATLAGDIQVNQSTSFEFGAKTSDSEPNRLFLLGRLSGKGDLVVDGHSRAFLTVGSDTADHTGIWRVKKGGLGSLKENAFDEATVILSGEDSQLGAYRLSLLRVRRVESKEGATISPVRGTVWIDEWIHEGEAVAPGIYREHPAMYRSSNMQGKQGRIVVGYDTKLH